MAALLEIKDLVTAYGRIEALRGVSLQVEQGSITCLLGPNGAGKTTLMMTTAGILRPALGLGPLRRQRDRGAPRRTASSSEASRWSPRTGSCSRT
jgi:ABC-type branched-subunit amino acid transport system ATPase component